MSGNWARHALSAYRIAGCAAYPMIGPYINWRTSRGKEDKLRRRERYGFAGVPRPEGPLVWIHAASVGETIAVIPLIERVTGVGLRILLTTGTRTSAQVVEERLGDRVIHQYVPLDLKPAVTRFLDHWQPDLAIVAESEIWPATIMELGKRRIPQILVNGRLSDRSFRSWRKRANLAEALFNNFALVIAQSELDGERFRSLGARPVTVAGNLKIDADPLPFVAGQHARLLDEISGRPRWAAISTHEGEEAIAGEVHLALKAHHPGFLTIIVPRHPERGDLIATQLEEQGLIVSRCSRRDKITPDTDIMLGDTMGDMGLYLRLTDIAFVGNSMTGKGGHNPIEPAMLQTVVLSGENVQNFRDPYQRLIDGGGARLIKNTEMLTGAISYLLDNEPTRRQMVNAAMATVDAMRGSLDMTLRALDPFIHPLIMKSRLEGGPLGSG